MCGGHGTTEPNVGPGLFSLMATSIGYPRLATVYQPSGGTPCAAFHLPLAILLLTLVAPPAPALPPPLSAQELDERSDFVGTVRVLGVTCIGTVEAPGNKEQVLAWQAWLQVAATKKGSPEPNETLLVQWQGIPKMLIGPWKVDYFPGEEAATHLLGPQDPHLHDDLVERQERAEQTGDEQEAAGEGGRGGDGECRGRGEVGAARFVVQGVR